MSYVIATRGSKLALWQAEFVREKLKPLGISAQLHVVKTSGDMVQDRPLHEMGGKGVFVKEIEIALLNGEADLAVHSLKDLPAEVQKPFTLPSILARHPAYDVILFSKTWEKRFGVKEVLDAEDFKDLDGLNVGTGSLRRSWLFQSVNPQIIALPLRGNIDTRINRLRGEAFDAIVLAGASIFRLPLVKDLACYTLNPAWFVPCAAQGALAIETLEDHPLVGKLRHLSDLSTEKLVAIERRVLALLGADCNLPVGVHAFAEGDSIRCRAVIFSDQGKESRVESVFSRTATVEDCAQEVFQAL